MPLVACSLCYSPPSLNLKRGLHSHTFTSHDASSFNTHTRWSSTGASAPLNNTRFVLRPQASCNLLSYYNTTPGLTTSQIVTSAFGAGTAAVLPFYALMVFAPRTNVTKKAAESSIPYVALGLVYAYLLYLSWTPDSVKLIFSGHYLLPEISGIAKLFSSEMTLASAWIHLLVVDLFAARQILHDGLENEVETRHSVLLCLFCCPLGIFTHFITKKLTRRHQQ